MGWTTFIHPIESDEKALGAFVNSQAVKPSQFRDGLSNTVAFSERVRGDGNSDSFSSFQDMLPVTGVPTGTPGMAVACRSSSSPTPPSHFSHSGRTWLVGGYVNTWYNHVFPPNSGVSDCALGVGSVDGGYSIVAARSFHPGQVNAAFADGSVRAIIDRIDADVWKHLGTRAGLEIVSDNSY